MFYKFFRPNENNVMAVMANALYAASPLKFNDPLESMCIDQSIPYMVNQSRVPHRSETSIRYQTRRFVICLVGSGENNIDINDSMLMWAHYADSHKGFCVEYGECIKHNLSQSTDYIDDHGIYYESTPPQVFNNANGYETEPILTKSRHWEYEHEYRFVFEKEGLHSLGNKPNDTIRAIYFGVEADMNSSLFRTLIMFAQTNDIPCFKMERSLSEYKLQFHSIS